jgi:hypothetical protein
VAAVAGQHVVVVENGKKQTQIPASALTITQMRLNGTTLVAASRSQLLVAKMGTKSSSFASIDFAAPVTAISDIVGTRMIVATADHGIHTVDVAALTLVSSRRIPNKLKLPKFSQINSVAVEENTVALLGESFILTADAKECEISSALRFNSSVPTGGVVVGSGSLQLTPAQQSPSKKKKKEPEAIESGPKTTLAVIASFKAVAKSLISPFERKQFQK